MGNTEKWELGTSEIGKSVGAHTDKSKTFKVYIAKILPLVKFGKEASKNVPINKNCFINASTCKPSIGTQVKSVNYLLVPQSNASKLKGSIKHGAQLKIAVTNHNVDKLSVVSKKDKSVNK